MFKFLEAFVEITTRGVKKVENDINRIIQLTRTLTSRKVTLDFQIRGIRQLSSVIRLLASPQFRVASANLASLQSSLGGIGGPGATQAQLNVLIQLLRRYLATVRTVNSTPIRPNIIPTGAVTNFFRGFNFALRLINRAVRILTFSLRLLGRAFRFLARAVSSVVLAALRAFRRAVEVLLAPTLGLARNLFRVRTLVLLLSGVLVRRLVQALQETRTEIERIRTLFTFTFGATARQELEFVSQTADRLGTNFQRAAESFSRLAFSGRAVGISLQSIRTLFTGVNEAVVALGLSSEQANSAFLAFQQIVERGTVSAEELRRQLGNAGLPAVALAARALGISIETLNKRLEQGAISSRELVDALGPELRRTFGRTARVVGQFTTQAKLNRLQNALFRLRVELGERLVPAFIEFQTVLLQIANTPRVTNILRGITDNIARLFQFLGSSRSAGVLFSGIVEALAPTVRLLTKTVELVGTLIGLLNVSVLAALNRIAQIALPEINLQLTRLLRGFGGLFGVTVRGVRDAVNLLGQLFRQAEALGKVVDIGLRLAVNRFPSVLLTLFGRSGQLQTAITRTFLQVVGDFAQAIAEQLARTIRGGVTFLEAQILTPVLGAVSVIARAFGGGDAAAENWRQIGGLWSEIGRDLARSATVLDTAGKALAADLSEARRELNDLVQQGFAATQLVDGARQFVDEIRRNVPQPFEAAGKALAREVRSSPLVAGVELLANTLRGVNAGPVGQAVQQGAEAAAGRIRAAFLDGSSFFQRLQVREEDTAVRAQRANTDAINRNTRELQRARGNGAAAQPALGAGGIS